MYNERRKKHFLIWKKMGASFALSTENRYLLLFRKTAPFEKALDQDFCEMERGGYAGSFRPALRRSLQHRQRDVLHAQGVYPILHIHAPARQGFV